MNVPELDQQLRSLIDRSRSPVKLEDIYGAEIEPLSDDDSRPERRWRSWRVPVLGAAAAVVVAATIAVIASDEGDSVSTEPAQEAPASTDSSLPTPPDTGPRVVIGPTRIADLTISATPLVPVTEDPTCPESASCQRLGWLEHAITIRNDGQETIYIDDTRTSTFTEGQQLIAADDLCGYGTLGESPEVHPGGCLAIYQGARLAPGESHDFPITLSKELPGMEPLTSAFASWSRELRFDTQPFGTGQHTSGTLAYIDIAYFDLVPQAPPTEPGDPGAPIEVALHHCGIDPITFDGQEWEVADDQEPFDATNAPAWFTGQGTIARSADGAHLVYTDETGFTLTFAPDDGREPPCA